MSSGLVQSGYSAATGVVMCALCVWQILPAQPSVRGQVAIMWCLLCRGVPTAVVFAAKAGIFTQGG